MPKKDAVLVADIAAPEIQEIAPIYPFIFIVVTPFADYKKGDVISDTNAIKTIIDNNHHVFCTSISR